MKAEASFILNKAAINKIDGTEARHYSELAEEAARNAEQDAARAEEVAREMESLDGRLDALEETVGDSSAGLVKDVSDAQGDISDLQDEALDVSYAANVLRLTLREKSDLPAYTYDDTKWFEATPYKSDLSFDIYVNLNDRGVSYESNHRKIIDFVDGNLYFVALLKGSYQSGHTFLCVEYSPTLTFATSLRLRGSGSFISGFTAVGTSGNFKVWGLGAGVYGTGNGFVAKITNTDPWATDPALPSAGTYVAVGSLVVDDVLALLDFNQDIVMKPVDEMRIDSDVYEIVDSKARSDISQLDSDLDTLGETVVTHGENIQTLFDTTDDIYEILQHSNVKPKSWSDTQQLVRDDLAKHIIAVRDQFESGYNNETLLWDVLDFNKDTPTDNTKTKSMTLQTHYILNDTLTFSPREAFYAFTEAGAAGKFYFTIGAQPWYASDVNKIFEFEIVNTTDIPVGAQFVMTQSYNATGDGATVKLYLAPGDLTEVEAVTMNIVSEPSAGAVNLGTINRTKQSNLNCIDRALLGNNNWKESLLRQWLNTDGAANTWWTAQNIWDRPASWVATTPGFMFYLDAEFKSVIGLTHSITIRNTLCDGGGTDETDDYFFLISREQAYNGTEISGLHEGSAYSYYADYSDLTTPGLGADTNRIKTKKGSSAAQYWWYRTPYSGNGHIVRFAGTSGALGSNGADGSYGVSPACNVI